MVIGKQGAEIEKLKLICAKKLGKNADEVFINIMEIKQPDLNAVLVSQSIATQLEKRVSFRRAVKQAIRNTMRLGARGITETYKEGTIPLQTIRADIDYGTAEAATTYGRIGVKVWIYQGEVLRESRNKAPRRRTNNNRRRENRKEGGNQ